MKKKSITALLLAVCMAATAAGCGSKEISNEYVTISQYKDVETQKASETKVKDEDVKAYIDQKLNEVTKEVKDRPLQKGDIANVQYEGKLNGETFDKGSLTIGEGDRYVDGFEEGMMGHNLNETFDVPVTFPEGYGGQEHPELSGADVVFTVTIQSIKEKAFDKPTDKFVKKVSKKSDTVKEYKEEVKKILEKENKKTTDEELQDNAWNAIMSNVEVTKYPKDRLKDTEKDVEERMEQMLGMYYGVTLDQYLEQAGVEEKDFKKQIKESSKEYLKQVLATELIAEKEGLVPSDKEYKDIMKKYAKDNQFKDVDEMVDTVGEDQVKEVILQDRVREWAAENCKQVEKTEDSEEKGQPAQEKQQSSKDTKEKK